MGLIDALTRVVIYVDPYQKKKKSNSHQSFFDHSLL